MLRLAAVILVLAGIGALFGPRRLRLAFLAVGACAVAYTILRLAGVVEGPGPALVG